MRPLRAEEIEVRVGTVGDGKVTLLLYKDARVDMAILDEEYGVYGWQRDHKEIKGNMYCGIGVKSPDGDWVWKWDCGTESNTEKEKGESSDSFKRAGFCWGIGRELYETPRITLKGVNTIKEGNRYKLVNQLELWGLYVKEFETRETQGKRICSKVIINQKTFKGDYEVYKWEEK